MGLVHKIFGTHSQHELKRIAPIADKVESYREEYGKLTDEQLKAKTKEFKERLAKGETLDDILPEAYATVREAGKRVLGMEHYRVQIIGGIILHQGRIAEMRTGEGKTLVCTLPAYLNAPRLSSTGCFLLLNVIPTCFHQCIIYNYVLIKAYTIYLVILQVLILQLTYITHILLIYYSHIFSYIKLPLIAYICFLYVYTYFYI